MDGRRTSHLALSLLLGLAVNGLCGCSLFNQNKHEVQRPPVGIEESDAGTSASPFASNAKPPRPEGSATELAYADLRFAEARSLGGQPEKQFRLYDDARQTYQAVLDGDPKNLKAARGLAGCYLAMRDYERASQTLHKAIETNPKVGILWADLSIIASKQNDFRTAVTRLNKALEMESQNQEIMKMLGVNLIFAGQDQRGIEMLTRAGGKSTAHYQAARIYERTGRIEQARQQVLIALDANPNFTDARAMLNDMEESSRAMPRPNPTGPMNPPVQGTLGDPQFTLERR